jgi:hypothetical protein
VLSYFLCFVGAVGGRIVSVIIMGFFLLVDKFFEDS